jgi:hypothetical protein
MKHFWRGLFILVTGLFLGLPVRAVTINVTYDTSVSNSPFFSQIKSALGVVTNTFHVLFTNSSSVNLTCYWGTVGPFVGGVQLGENIYQRVGPFTYAEITNALRSARSSASDSNSVASLPASDPIATNKWWVPRAEVKALPSLASLASIGNPSDTVNDGSIAFADNVLFTFSPTNRQLLNHYDFIGVAEHEISEVMGRNSGLNVFPQGVYLPFDLFRFTNSGARNFNIDAANAYFSVNKGTNNLKNFCQDYTTTGDDPQDWEPGAVPDAFDTTANPGYILPLTPVDLTAMDVLGYNLPVFSASHLKVTLTNGMLFLSFTNVAGAPFSVFMSTDVALDITNWTYLGAPAEISPGQYQYFDGQFSPRDNRFYRVSLP